MQTQVARATKSSAIVPASKSFTQQMFESMERTSETGGAGGSVTYEAFKRADEAWFKLRNMKVGFSPCYSPHCSSMMYRWGPSHGVVRARLVCHVMASLQLMSSMTFQMQHHVVHA